jgi:hypothetical protein
MEEERKEGQKHETECKIRKRRGKINMGPADWESGHTDRNKNVRRN